MKTKLLILALVAFALFGQATISNGTKTVTTAGTAVRIIANDTIFKSGTIQALSSNSGVICIGSSTVLAASKNGTCLTAGQAAPLYTLQGFPFNLANFWIDSTVNAEGVSYTIYQ